MTPSGILDIIIIIYYFPAFLLAIYTGLKHGFGRSAGWFQLNLLSIFRLVGSSLGLAAVYQPSIGIIVASAVFSGLGTVTLVDALVGLIGRVDQNLKDKAINPRVVKIIHMITIIAIVLAMVGAGYAFSSDADRRDYGHYLSKVAVILIIVIFVLAICICAHSTFLHHLVPAAEKRLLYVAVISLPFVLVRIVLATCSTILYTNSNFSMLSSTIPAVIIRALMGVFMEFVVVTLYLWAGCTVGRSTERDAQRAEEHGANGVYQSRFGKVHNADLVKEERAPAEL